MWELVGIEGKTLVYELLCVAVQMFVGSPDGDGELRTAKCQSYLKGIADFHICLVLVVVSPSAQ